MLIARKDLDQLTEDDLQQLIDNQVSESKTMEYKQALPSLHPPEKKREFLADVSSFANTVGGCIVFGMKAQDGVPLALTGLEGLNSDTAILQLDQAIRDGIAPRIQGIRWSPPIPLRNGKPALVLYIPQSADAPHMVTAGTTSRFWARDTRGKYDMDVQQIRAAFLASDAVNQRLRRLREIRPEEIAAGKTPVALAEGATVLVLLASEPALRYPDTLDQERLLRAACGSPLGLENSFYRTYNADGVLAHQSDTTAGQSTKCWKYVQVYRNGVVEHVRVYARHARNDGRQLLPYKTLEEELLAFCSAALTMYREAGVQPPVVIMVTALRAAGFSISNHDFPALRPQTITTDVLPLPEVQVHTLDQSYRSLADALRTPFDVLWNAFGAPEWLNYRQWCGE